MDDTDPMDDGRCTARSRTGERCRRAPANGASVCSMHGGRAPPVDVAAHYRQLCDRIEFRVLDLASAPEQGLAQDYDIVLSKDTFEHVDDVEAMLCAIFRVLKQSGELWAGFSPLYWSPKGDHGRTSLRLPWAHAILPPTLVLMAASRYNQKPVRRLYDIGLNGMTSPEFFSSAEKAGFDVESVLFNRGDKRFMTLFRKIRQIPFLERPFTISIYTVMRAGA
jgi:SAM-dependent methyltransferase